MHKRTPPPSAGPAFSFAPRSDATAVALESPAVSAFAFAPLSDASAVALDALFALAPELPSHAAAGFERSRRRAATSARPATSPRPARPLPPRPAIAKPAAAAGSPKCKTPGTSGVSASAGAGG
eukprot:CAMPEP_0184709934 /NCGR_PEP_ID=MMETSP0314-20130426/934_1 /TAXON_ID=38298 /ORGANISM="Rhodella maculata, Strain CCMP 736" /LENGTH=123 /DNA_ID=CAMNT_0027171709 /DNA_START=36 /DNA_END=404 /DNA_ORIENTATION=-